MDYSTLYKQKLTTAEKAAQAVKSGDWLDYGWGNNTTVAFDKAFAARLPELENKSSCGSLYVEFLAHVRV